MNAKRRREIANFQQKETQTLGDVGNFLRRIEQIIKTVADATSIEGLLDKTYTKAKGILLKISHNNDEWKDDGWRSKTKEQ